MKKIFLISGLLVFCIGVSIGVLLNKAKQKHKEISINQIEFSVTKKVMVINFNPIIENQGNRRLTEVLSWNNPQNLTNQYIIDVKQTSGNYVNYYVVDWQDIDDFPQLADGFDYTDTSWFNCWNNHSVCHEPWLVNYQKILNDFQVCEKRNSGEIDELWLWGGPWFGYWEAVMTGPNAFFTNGPVITNTSCQKQLHIMGFNYERGVSEMLEDLGHRTEGTLSHLFGEDSRGNGNNNKTPWGKFALSEKTAPGNSGCGWMHYAPNSQSDYDWSNQRTVSSSCEDWLNYPNLTGAKQSFNCSRWNCSGYDFKKWWLSHLPKASGQTDGKWNNWWRYVIDFEEAISPPASPSPSPSSSASPYPTPACSLIFSVNGISCKGLSGNINVALNDVVAFSCSKDFSSTEAVAYFRALLNDAVYTESGSVKFGDSDNASWNIKINKTGNWRIQCRICNNINQNTCTTWGQAH